MDIIYGKNFFYFKGKVHELNNFLQTLPSDITVKDYLNLMLH